MEPFGLPTSPHVEKIEFTGNTLVAGSSWQTWTKPAGKSYLTMVLFGGGGGGGAGAIGNPAAASGGGGGGSGGLTIVEVPLALLPNRLYVSVGGAKTGAGIGTYVSTQPNLTSNHVFACVYGGLAGGNASGATAGTAGSPAGPVAATNMPIGWVFRKLILGGQAGTAGGTGYATGGALTLPTTGIRTTGGTGGGGVGADGGNGESGGSFIIPASPTHYLPHPGGVGPVPAEVAPSAGNSGFRLDTGSGGYLYYGGTGGGSSSTNGLPITESMIQAPGGNGGIGSGGGGSGGAITGSVAAPLSYGGAGLAVFVCY